ncbi:MAG: SsrA-binding protein SmpB, partial [Clostridiales Family XIII bacterium]|nr:SsrA-binding protein SmpB [Clostridiales Family XIII bacterium]
MSKQKILVNNKSARHDYFIEEKFEAGIALTGTEIKSLRAGRANLKESYARIIDGELMLLGMNISPYEHGNINNPDPLRPRKLLLHRRELRKLEALSQLQGLTIVP